MWLIESEKNTFLDNQDIDNIISVLKNARFDKKLTLIIGNGPSQSAVWLHNQKKKQLNPTHANFKDLSWAGVVKDVAHANGVKKELVTSSSNNLALAQAVLVAYENKGISADDARSDLVSSLKSAFNEHIEPSIIDQIIVKLAPQDIITTNYDFQLERAFNTFAKDNWVSFVRHGQARLSTDASTWIHKMHGSFSPPDNMSAHYRFSELYKPENLESSIVITESDYDECYRNLSQAQINSSALLVALSKTCLIIGKSIDAQDISFIYALRKTRSARKASGNTAFMLFNDPPSPTDQVYLNNLEITPIVINLPRRRNSGHYYVGLTAALARIFNDMRPFFEKMTQDPLINYSELISRPNVVSIGLASQNITGRTEYLGENIIPPAGRRNLRYTNVEEHIGGSAVIPLTILAALDTEKKFRSSLVSSVGVHGDNFTAGIFRTLQENQIDTDAISQNQPVTWHSTVLVHTSKTHTDEQYPGQRIFLDRGYNDRVNLDHAEQEQLHAQLTQPNLSVVYIDKFLAAEHPPVKTRKDIYNYGCILQPENFRILTKAIYQNPEIDIVYETGGGGSPFQHVEEKLQHITNIFTAGFPFFANTVLTEIYGNRLLPLREFSNEHKWWEADFSKETAAIEAFLSDMVPNHKHETSQRIFMFDISDNLLELTQRWAQRRSESNRQWFIVTLHHFGVIGIDLNWKVGWYCRPFFSSQKIENTSGAGDSFRGALLYFLLLFRKTKKHSLAHALLFATEVATERCLYFSMADAYKAISSKSAHIIQNSENYFLDEAVLQKLKKI